MFVASHLCKLSWRSWPKACSYRQWCYWFIWRVNICDIVTIQLGYWFMGLLLWVSHVSYCIPLFSKFKGGIALIPISPYWANTYWSFSYPIIEGYNSIYIQVILMLVFGRDLSNYFGKYWSILLLIFIRGFDICWFPSISRFSSL